MPLQPRSSIQPVRRLLPAVRTLVQSIFAALLLMLLASLGDNPWRSSVYAQSSVGELFLPMVAAANPPGPQPDPQPGGPTSELLIESARQQGKINDETAVLYRVYAGFGDARLPAQYRGDDRSSSPTLALRQAQAQMASYSAATQAALAPFLLPPQDPNSWVEQQAATLPGSPVEAANRIVWHSTCQTDPNLKVWYQQRFPEDADDAHQICELARGEVWPRLVSLFGQPLPDDGGMANNGGDEQLDLYLVNANTGAVGYSGCDNTPSYILINRNRWSRATLAEVMMSAFVNGYDSADCVEYMWLFAASSTWAADYVYPEDGYEHQFADDFLNHTRFSLNTYPVVPLEAENDLGSGAYLWLWYATNFVSSAKEILPALWQGAMNPDSLAVMNSALGAGGFAQHWKDFSLQNWNNEPVTTYFETDLLLYSTKPELDEEVSLTGAQDLSYALDGEVNSLAAHTFHFKFTDPAVRSVLFINPFVAGNEPTARVQALYRLAEGDWKTEDWTNIYSREFCRDLKAERVEELTLVISNHEWQNRDHELAPAYPPRLNVTNMACRGWAFEGTATLQKPMPGHVATEKTTISAKFLRLEMGDDNSSHPFSMYQVSEGSGSWTHSGSTGACSGRGNRNYTLAGGPYTVLFVFNNATDHATGTLYTPGERRYSGFGQEDALQNVIYRCSGGGTVEVPVWSAYRWFFTETIATQQASADGKTITGAFRLEEANGVVVDYSWTMTALPPE